MPWMGSVKSSDSTMLSCLSPRRPCCGPNAAVSLTPAAASASRLWVRSRATEAGCARRATRLPSSGLRSSELASSRSIPNRVMAAALGKPRGEAIGRVEIGLVDGRMRERPVGFGAVFLLEDCGEAELPLRVRVHGDGCPERPPGEIVFHSYV